MAPTKSPNNKILRLQESLSAVLEHGMSIRGAAKSFNIAKSTLHDRISGKIHIDAIKPVMTQYEEAIFVGHIKYMSSIGYGYTRAEIMRVAGEYLCSVGKRAAEKPMSSKWFYNFMNRWPELKAFKPSSLEMVRAKCSNKESIDMYYTELDGILTKYNLKDKPECIYNIDEKGLSTEHKPPTVIGFSDLKPQSLTSPRSTSTVIGCGNAAGTALPPYFVFKGVRLMPELMNNTAPGSGACMTPTGWSNSVVFQEYLSNHFMKYCQRQGTKLILFDGHKSHINPGLIDWAKSKDLVLFVLPPHTSWLLQPLDVGCYGPLSRAYNYELQRYMMRNPGRIVTRYEVAELASNAYSIGLSNSNLISSFKKCGIVPFDRNAYDKEKAACTMLFSEPVSENINSESIQSDDESQSIGIVPFLVKRKITAQSVIEKQKEINPPKVRKTLSKIVGGRAITESKIQQKVADHVSSQVSAKPCVQRKKNPAVPKKGKGKGKKSKKTVVSLSDQAMTRTIQPDEPSTSGNKENEAVFSQSDSEEQVSDSEKCCVCKCFQPPSLKQRVNLTLVNWAQCDVEECKHWIHLSFCTPVRSVSRNDLFLCPHCSPETPEM